VRPDRRGRQAARASHAAGAKASKAVTPRQTATIGTSWRQKKKASVVGSADHHRQHDDDGGPRQQH
jgi:hypothetical protein